MSAAYTMNSDTSSKQSHVNEQTSFPHAQAAAKSDIRGR
ncbi:hypothetical protein CGMCC3_g13699 [Colletotrichum fructicola]|nr:uncharacterized protein CGMCC3_g13699 [Colletotrichum fructicola]KAE9570174.1 hypothetical protein CGMCC3_g13699 [Colletotrichum fructicola]